MWIQILTVLVDRGVSIQVFVLHCSCTKATSFGSWIINAALA